jgi:V/A-type H+-transporting ATPase subunit C
MISEDLGSLLGNISEDPVALLVISLALLVLIVLVIGTYFGYFRVLLNIAQFAYPVARAKAIGNPFVKKEQVFALVEAGSFNEFLTILQETGAGPEIPENASPEDMEKILESWHYQEIQQMGTSIPDAIRPFFTAYIGLLESEQILTAIRSVYSAGPDPRLAARMSEIGCITPALIENIAESPDIRDLISRLQGTPYGGPLSVAYQEYEETSSIAPLESAVRVHVMKNLNASKGRVDPAVLSPVLAFTGSYADITNILTLIRAKSRNLPPELVMQWLVPGGAYYEEWRLKQLYESSRPADILRQIEGSEYYQVLESLIPGTGSRMELDTCELFLDRYLLSRVTGLASVHHLTGGPLIKFAIARKYEMRNLRILYHTGLEMRPLSEALPYMVLQEA